MAMTTVEVFQASLNLTPAEARKLREDYDEYRTRRRREARPGRRPAKPIDEFARSRGVAREVCRAVLSGEAHPDAGGPLTKVKRHRAYPGTARPGARKPETPLTDEQRALVADNWLLAKYTMYEVCPGLTKGLRSQGMAADEIEQEALYALMRAARKYDASLGVKFATYATESIRRSLLRLCSLRSRQLEFDRTHYQSTGDYVDTAGRERDENRERAESVRLAMQRLDERTRAIVAARFGLGDEPAKTLAEVGAMFNLTRERVRQIVEKALEQLAGPLADWE